MLLLDEEESEVNLASRNVKIRRLEDRGKRCDTNGSTHETVFSMTSGEGKALESSFTTSVASASTPFPSFRAKGGDGLAKMDLLRYGTVPAHVFPQEKEVLTPIPFTSVVVTPSCRLSAGSVTRPAAFSSPASTSCLDQGSLNSPLRSAGSVGPAKTPDAVYPRMGVEESGSEQEPIDLSPLGFSLSSEDASRSMTGNRSTSATDVLESPSPSSPCSQKSVRTIVKTPSKRCAVARPVVTPPAVKQARLTDFFGFK